MEIMNQKLTRGNMVLPSKKKINPVFLTNKCFITKKINLTKQKEKNM
jgi:hypothetical protein